MKALKCGINAVGGQGCGCMSTFCHAPLKIAVLLHKTAKASHSFSGTVSQEIKITLIMLIFMQMQHILEIVCTVPENECEAFAVL